MKKSLLNICFCLFCWCMSAQQNLIPNGSFENYSNCPTSPNQVYLATGWNDPTNASSDYYNTCSTFPSPVGVPTNQFGYQLAYDGEAYLGFATYDINYKNYREYIGIKLINKLTVKNKYCISAYVSLADNCRYGTNNLGFCFSENPVTGTAPNPINLTPQINFADRIFNNIIDWELIESEFIADGNEEYLTIGNFYTDTLTQFLVVDSSNFIGSYYYIDKIILYNCGEIIIPNVITPNNDGINDLFTIKNLNNNNVLTIYSRWGNLIYKATNYQNDWSPSDEMVGTYYYLLQTETQIYKGFFEIFK